MEKNRSNLLIKDKGEDLKSIRKKLYVKYMVCLRDKILVQSVLNEQGLNYRISAHGAIEFLSDFTIEQYRKLFKELSKSGLILLDEKQSMLIDRIINTIVEVIHYSDTLPKLNFTDLINDQVILGEESILKIFSDVKGMSVLQFIVIQKIERAKELLLYDEMSLAEIAELLNYKDQNYLSAQFKQVTGLTPSYFKRLKKARLKIVKKRANTGQKNTA